MITLVLIVILMANLALMLFLCAGHYKSKKHHQQKTEALQLLIIELLKDQRHKNQQVFLADDLKERLRTSQNRINKEILELQYQFLDILAGNNLLE